ncbi:uncharacterized protein BJ171DRAFT_583570 [Polychytrium aggregatum]|uniref:uncharacterized protein n=1 Tax=Polychytrium aggregatum TaxID=110093 RepID=UPI0022FE91EE|nr:uncharacterized protein BJ171DRAFT_583570 [Polychytrium aggregatum]KAI9203084.1 hypothetical protein BJ171DRAFT_583570 [Polychytrium aggregatum]
MRARKKERRHRTKEKETASQATPAIDNDALNRLKLGAGGAAPFQLNAAAASSDTSSPTDSPPPTSGSPNTGVFIGIGSAAGVLGVAGAAYAAFRNKLFKKSYAAASQKADEPFSTKLNIMKPSFSAPSSSSSSSSASRSTAPTVGQDGKATHPFRATLPDELNVSVGDVITVEEDFGDNWGRCRNVFSNAVGVAPLTIFVRK